MLDIAAMQDLSSQKVTSVAMRKVVAHRTGVFGLSERRACQSANADRKIN